CATGLRYAPNMSDYSAPRGFLQGTKIRLLRGSSPADHDMMEIGKEILCGFYGLLNSAMMRTV
ncbi:MAG: hypothetical protein ABUK16_04930, partial [Anaerolineales bacterium]